MHECTLYILIACHNMCVRKNITEETPFSVKLSLLKHSQLYYIDAEERLFKSSFKVIYAEIVESLVGLRVVTFKVRAVVV